MILGGVSLAGLSRKERLDFVKEQLDGFVRNNGAHLGRQRMDSGDTIAFARALDEVRSRTYDILYPELKRNRLIPNVPIDPASETVTYRQFDQLGEAQLIHDYAKDFHNVDVKGLEFLRKVNSYGASYQYSIQDLRAAKKADYALDAKKAEAARQAIERKLEKVCALGDPDTKGAVTPVRGLANHDNITLFQGTGQSVGGSDITGKWDLAATAVQTILDDLNKMQAKIFNDTKGEFEADTLVLPNAVFSALSTRQRSTTFTEDSILQYILSQSPWLKEIEFWPYLEFAGGGGSVTAPDGTASRAILYKKDPMVLEQRVAVEFEQFAPQPEGMVLKVHCHARHGGVAVMYPKAVMVVDGLQNL